MIEETTFISDVLSRGFIRDEPENEEALAIIWKHFDHMHELPEILTLSALVESFEQSQDETLQCLDRLEQEESARLVAESDALDHSIG